MLDLNANQLQAVKIYDKPLIIKAGPGTGKTKTLVAKVKFLVSSNFFSPSEIGVLTFTDKAAKELLERLKVEKVGKIGFVGTFHALAFRELSKLREIKLVPPQLRKNIILEIINRQVEGSSLAKFKLTAVELVMTRYKNALNQEIPDEYKIIIEKYAEKLEELGFVDYDDLLVEFNQTLGPDPKEDQHRHDARQFGYLLVDEVQDTNNLQYEIIKKLSARLCVIGDPLQSIYGFRGASPDIFKQFKVDFQDSIEISLDTNYRSTIEVIESSHSLFPEGIKLHAANNEHGAVRVISTLNEFSEADYVIREIAGRVGGLDLNQSASMHQSSNGKTKFSDFVVIYRIHSLGRILREKFNKSGIPFQIVGEGNVYEGSEFQFLYTLLRYLKLGDEADFDKIIRSKYVGCSNDLIERLKLNSDSKLRVRVKIALEQRELPVNTTQKLYNLFRILQELSQKLPELKFSQMVGLIDKNFGLLENVKTESLRYLLMQAVNDTLRFDRYGSGAFEKYSQHIENIILNEGLDSDADKVILMTMHASKGLEFQNVFICGFEQGIIPFQKSIEEGNIEEEKRLLYVAMTRAKDNLTLIKTETRNNLPQQESEFGKLLKKCNLVNYVEDEFSKKAKAKSLIIKQKKSQLGLF